MTAVLLYLSQSLHWNGDYVLLQWFLGLSVAFGFLSLKIWEKLHWLPAVSFFYFAENALYSGFYRYQADHYGQYLSNSSLVCLVCVCALIAFGLSADDWTKKAVLALLPIYGLLNSIYVIVGAITGHGLLIEGVGFSGFENYSGMNGVSIALSMPFWIKKCKRWWIYFLVCLAALVLSQSTISYGVLGIGLIAYWICDHKNPLEAFVCVLWIPALMAIFEKKHILNSSHRFQAYKVFLGAWWRNAEHFLGSGFGTFQVIGPIIQDNTGFMISPDHHYYWIWMHSDWLQTLFEGGYVGLALMGGLALHVLYKLYKLKDVKVFSLASGLCAAGVFDFPLRYLSLSLLAVLTVRVAYEKRSDAYNSY